VERSIGGGSAWTLSRGAMRSSFVIRKPNDAKTLAKISTITEPSIGLNNNILNHQHQVPGASSPSSSLNFRPSDCSMS
jgi:hypothetical protein